MPRSTSPASTSSAPAPSTRRNRSSSSASAAPETRRNRSSSSATGSRPRGARAGARDTAMRSYLVLQELQADRVSKRARYHHVTLPEADGDEDSPHPWLDYYRHSVRDEGVLNLCNFTPTEISTLWSRVSGHMATRWNVGPGNKCKHSGIDVLFMTLCVLKNGGSWDLLASSFEEKGPTFHKMIIRFLEVLSPYVFRRYVEHAERDYSMRKVVLAGHAFTNYPAARNAVDVTFQQANMPSGTQSERASYYSAKHKLHGYKTELSVIPTGMAINCSHHYRGSTADITIFRKNEDFHLAAMVKAPPDANLEDGDPMLEEYPDTWAILADKGYQGLADAHRAIIPFRRRPSTPLTPQQEAVNGDISSDRVVVENYFGRLITLWAMCADKFRWKEERYEMYFRACVALTNINVRAHPLRRDDGENYKNYLRRMYSIGSESRERRIESNKRSRERRERRIIASRMAVGNLAFDSESDTELSQEY